MDGLEISLIRDKISVLRSSVFVFVVVFFFFQYFLAYIHMLSKGNDFSSDAG